MEKMERKNTTLLTFALSNDLRDWLRHRRKVAGTTARFLIEKGLRELRARMENKKGE